eukprot:TRINITY_DN76812_c0_g1_i1.p1 TRINITY_DN76812_c0_g1~~TRINITY_DN76812_c0_g1_i1.p1  ORF type:complete len:717 (-),score=169.10 TRINITY_DN76812_c0_g1_i1:27-2177(-)
MDEQTVLRDPEGLETLDADLEDDDQDFHSSEKPALKAPRSTRIDFELDTLAVPSRSSKLQTPGSQTRSSVSQALAHDGNLDALVLEFEQRELSRKAAQLVEQQEIEALFASLESLAEAAASRVLQGAPQDAVLLLQRALAHCDSEASPPPKEVPVQAQKGTAEAPAMNWSDDEEEEKDAARQKKLSALSVALARAGVGVLLCTALSQVGEHAEAVAVAKEATDVADGLIAELSEAGSTELLQRAVELAVQVRQCHAVELEFTVAGSQITQPVAEDTPLGEVKEEAAANEHAPPSAAAELDPQLQIQDQLFELHCKSVELAVEHLPPSSPVRQRAQQAQREWQMRLAGAPAPVDRGFWQEDSLLRPSSQKAWRMAISRPGTSSSEAGLGLPRHERMYLGIPPPVDLRQERLRRKGLLGASAKSSPSASRPFTSGSTMSSMDFRDDIGMAEAHDLDPLQRRLSAPSMTFNESNSLELSRPTTGSEFWGKQSVRLGDLYSGSSYRDRAKQLPTNSSNWSSERRVPVLFTMSGPGGRAAWALRKAEAGSRRSNVEKRSINAFEDYRKNASGPKVNLKDQVLQTEGGMMHFQHRLKHESYMFKNFWLKDEVTADDLWQDRTFFCEEGLRVLRKSPTKQLRPVTPLSTQAQDLFNHFGVSGPKVNQIDISTSHEDLSAYGKLLEKSQKVLKTKMPRARDHRTQNMPSKKKNDFAALQGLFNL